MAVCFQAIRQFRPPIALRTFTYYNGIVGNTSVADGALILHMIT